MKQVRVVATTLFILASYLSPQINIAVVDFVGRGVPQQEVSALTDRLRTEIFLTGRYTVVERELMEEILIEQDFQQTGCTTNECLLKIGKLIGVNQIVGGSISRVGRTYSIAARTIDVETGEIINVALLDHTGSIDELLISGMNVVAVELASDATSQRRDTRSLTMRGGINRPTLGGLEVSSEPSGARVFILSNGEKVYEGVTANDLPEIITGKYSVALSKTGYENWETDIEIIPGKKVITNVFLRKEQKPLLTLRDLGYTKRKESKQEPTRGTEIIADLVWLGGIALMPVLPGEVGFLGLVGGFIGWAYIMLNGQSEDVPIRDNIAYNRRITQELNERNRSIQEENEQIKKHNSTLPKPSIYVELLP